MNADPAVNSIHVIIYAEQHTYNNIYMHTAAKTVLLYNAEIKRFKTNLLKKVNC